MIIQIAALRPQNSGQRVVKWPCLTRVDRANKVQFRD